jgi:hypothetical protein
VNIRGFNPLNLFGSVACAKKKKTYTVTSYDTYIKVIKSMDAYDMGKLFSRCSFSSWNDGFSHVPMYIHVREREMPHMRSMHGRLIASKKAAATKMVFTKRATIERAWDFGERARGRVHFS